MSADHDAIIVGGGLAGLTAGRRLAESGSRVLVLEAAGRLGGRTETVNAEDGTPVDLGGQWVGPGQERMLALLEELGLSTFPQYTDGQHRLSILGEHKGYTGDIPALGLVGLIDLQWTLLRIERMAKSLDPAAPGSHKRSREWDAVHLEEWLRSKTRSVRAFALITAAVRAVFAKEPDEISLLQFLLYARAAGSLRALIETRGGAQDRRIDGGARQLSELLAQRIRTTGGEVRLDCPVTAIEQNDSGVRVHSAETRFTARFAAIAMAPTASERIRFHPGLPEARRRLERTMQPGNVIKCVAVYDRPFWRQAGFSGQFVGDRGPLTMTFDDSPRDDRHAALVGFILADAARHWSEADASARRDAVLEQLAGIFGAQAQQPREFLEKDWSRDDWATGCYTGLMAPGDLLALSEALRSPYGRLHWAGTETATRWSGYMEGALQSGERAARELRDRLAG